MSPGYLKPHVDPFRELFRGNEACYGVHVPERSEEGTKAKGKSFTKREPITYEMYREHLHGKLSLGVVPIDANGNVRFAVIDVDKYPVDPMAYIRPLERAGLPFVCFRSKSGGLHLYCFMKEDTPAAKMVPLINEVRQMLGLPRDTELFPKQTKLSDGQVGNWINLPYYNAKDTTRCAYSDTGEKLSLGDALARCKHRQIKFKELESIVRSVPLSEAPPCLQTLYIQGGAPQGHRNAFLFNCATYLKARFGDEYAEYLHQLNGKMDAPLSYDELNRSVVSSHNKGDYSYQCKDGLLSDCCDREICKLREYGKGGGTVSDLSFERLVQVKCSEPYYKWTVNGVEMTFYSENALMNQTKFRELCLRHLHKVPDRLKDPKWNEILNRALDNVEIDDVEAQDDLSEGSLWSSKVVEFLSRRPAMRPSQVEEGLVYKSNGNIYFKGAKILEFLDSTNSFKHMRPTQHRELLKELGTTRARLRYPDKGSSGRVWCVEQEELERRGYMQPEALDEPEEELKELDFADDEEKF